MTETQHVSHVNDLLMWVESDSPNDQWLVPDMMIIRRSVVANFRVQNMNSELRLDSFDSDLSEKKFTVHFKSFYVSIDKWV